MCANDISKAASNPSINRSTKNKGGEWVRRAVTHEYFPLLLLIVLNLVLGLAIANHYGEAIDEHNVYIYGDNTLSFYTSWFDWKSPVNYGPGHLRFYGPSYLIPGTLVAKFLRIFLPSWTEVGLWHWVNFLVFQLGLLFFYSLCRRLVGKLAAYAAVLLFSTQPLLYGHAFINPKDIPFMVFFLAAVASGVRMAEDIKARIHEVPSRQAGAGMKGSFLQDWGSASTNAKRWLVISWGILMVILLAWLVGVKWLVPALVHWLYSLDPGSILGGLFAGLAENATQVAPEMYILKALRGYNRLLVVPTLLVLCMAILVGGIVFRSSLRRFWKCYGSLLWAGLLLGLCTSVRVLGPAAGLLVAIYFLLRAGQKAVFPLAGYILVGVVVADLSWPYLWAAPFARFLESFQIMSEFPWEGRVLFQGVDYKSDDLPRTYLPVLLSLQFTLPVLVLFTLGVIAAVIRSLKRTLSGSLVIILFAWFFLPLLLVVLVTPVMYDNFRQFLFITPPIFLFAAVGFQTVFSKFQHRLMQVLILLFAIAPGIYWNITLHPYQYVYYNLLTGGVHGAFRKYEMDYWMTSYKEAADFLNEMAPRGSRIVVWGLGGIVRRYVRDDLSVDSYQPSCNFDFAVLTSRHSKDLDLFPHEPIVFQTGRQGAIYAVVKQLRNCKSGP
jgi:hypothetical protein